MIGTRYVEYIQRGHPAMADQAVALKPCSGRIVFPSTNRCSWCIGYSTSRRKKGLYEHNLHKSYEKNGSWLIPKSSASSQGRRHI